MKTIKGLGFGFSAVNAGQRNVVVEPQLIAVSTEGNFRITPPVSRVLGIGHGEYVMFLNNIDNIDAAIREKAQEIIDFCEANGLELDTPEAVIAIHKEFDVWAITKGIKEYDPKGNVRTTAERLTKNDKTKFVLANFDEMLEAAMQDASDEVKDALSREGITKEEQVEILISAVQPREVEKFKGSRCANPGGNTGAGTILNFTDSNVWKQMKSDMGEDATKFNRVFDIDIDNIQDAVVNNGYEDVNVKILILGEFTDKEPSRVGNKDEE